jgi:hypothetical protein
MQLSFGAGAVWGERTDVAGSGIGPRQFGVLQDIQIDFDWTTRSFMVNFNSRSRSRVGRARSPARRSSPRSLVCCIPTSFSDLHRQRVSSRSRSSRLQLCRRRRHIR